MERLATLSTTLTRSFALSAALVISFTAVPQAVNAQFTIVHRFGDGSQPHDGAVPDAGLTVTPDGIFGATEREYTTATEGISLRPNVFKLLPDGSVDIIQAFDRSLLNPICPLLFYNGGFVGTIYRGPLSSPHQFGAVFRLSSANGVWHKTWWHEFSDIPPSAMNPNSPMILGSDGSLYGTAHWGGASGWGAIYKLDPATQSVSTVFSFPNANFSSPSSLMLGKDGNYYGTTIGNLDTGTIFKMTPDGTVTRIYTFKAMGQPYAPLIQGTDGDFYGTTGAYPNAVVFKMTPDHVVTVLHTFGQGTDGEYPGGLVQGPNGNLYGATSQGGSAGGGTIFEITTDGSSYSILHNFGDGSVTNDGLNPLGLVVGSDNNLYGTTAYGGISNRGTIFKISP